MHWSTLLACCSMAKTEALSVFCADLQPPRRKRKGLAFKEGGSECGAVLGTDLLLGLGESFVDSHS